MFSVNLLSDGKPCLLLESHAKSWCNSHINSFQIQALSLNYMKWMKEFWIYTIKNFTLIAMIFFSSLNIITLSQNLTTIYNYTR